MSQTPPPATPLSNAQEEKLRELTAQSWNLELVISGAALVAVLQLPELIDEGFDYLKYNLMTQTAGPAVLLPGLAYSIMKGMCYVLFVAFLTNFVMRAYWVGLVGLLAIYPDGIQYDRLPFSTKHARERMANDLGPLNAYILRLDQRCNVVFAFSFLFVFFLLGLSFTYVLIFLFYFILCPLLLDTFGPEARLIGYGLGSLLLLALIVVSLPQVKAHPQGEALHARLMAISKLFFAGLSKPSSFIVNTFLSNLPKKTVGLMSLAMFVGFIILLVVELIANSDRVYGHTISPNLRHLYPSRVIGHSVNVNAYNDQRAAGAYVDGASIQSDVIREPFLRLYVAYPKALDTLLTQLAPTPVWSDELSRDEKRRLQTEWSINQIGRLIRVEINGSLYRNPDLSFTQSGPQQQQGWQTIVIPSNLKTGKNLLTISIQANSTTKQTPIVTIPFWYVPES